MKELNSAQIGVAAGSLCRLPRPIAFPPGRACVRLRAEATVTAKQINAVAQTLTGATAKAILACLFDTATLRFGDRHPEIVDSSLPYARAREMYIAQSMDDFLISAPGYNGGLPKRVRDVADADVVVAATATNATAVITVEYARTFELARLAQDAYAYIPGETQIRQVQWEFARSGVFESSGNWTQAQAADVLFLADDTEATDDQWAFVPRLYQQEEAGRESHGPKTPIGLLTLWEYTLPGGATTLTLYSIRRNGDSPIQDTVRARRYVSDAQYTDPIGAYDLNALATVLHNIPGDSEKHDIPVGEGFLLAQTGSELNPPKTAWLHIPVRTREEIDAYVGENVADAQGVKAINASAKAGKNVATSIAALEPYILARASHADFESLPGRVYVNGLPAKDHIPDQITRAATAQVAGATGQETKAAMSDKASKAIAKAMPGMLSGVRGRASASMRGFGARLLGR